MKNIKRMLRRYRLFLFNIFAESGKYDIIGDVNCNYHNFSCYQLTENTREYFVGYGYNIRRMEKIMRYQIKNAIVQYGADTILKSVNFEIHDTEKIAIVGRNGCGKTRLLKLIAGEIEMSNPDSDESCGITMAGKQEIGFLRQISFEDGGVTVEDEIKKTFSKVFKGIAV